MGFLLPQIDVPDFWGFLHCFLGTYKGSANQKSLRTADLDDK